jgi:Eukaryotic-type carbonic anhydrase
MLRCSSFISMPSTRGLLSSQSSSKPIGKVSITICKKPCEHFTKLSTTIKRAVADVSGKAMMNPTRPISGEICRATSRITDRSNSTAGLGIRTSRYKYPLFTTIATTGLPRSHPCTELVTWLVADIPMKISHDQLWAMRTMLFANVDGDFCRPISTHWMESVARPLLQNVNGRTTHHCTPRRFRTRPVN